MRFMLIPCGVFLLTSLCFSARADDEDAAALPSVEVMPCLEKCGAFVPAKHVSENMPYWRIETADDYVEAQVQIRYNIGTDGLVHDAVVLNVTGPNSFVKKALDAVKQWTFEPATLDGKPVTESRILDFDFTAPKMLRGARDSIISAYGTAVELTKAGKFSEAEAKLKEQQAKSELNFYERGMLANLMGVIALQRKDYQAAEDQVKIATDFYTADLPAAVTIQLYKTRIAASLATGNVMDAMGATDRLKKVTGFDPNDPITKVVADARAKLNAAPVFSMAGRIPEARAGLDPALVAAADANTDPKFLTKAALLYLYRRDFGFRNIVGSVDKFQLSCKQQTIESRITEAAEWHVPKNWSQCYLFVSGTPGSTFDVLQFAPDTTGAPAAKP